MDTKETVRKPALRVEESPQKDIWTPKSGQVLGTFNSFNLGIIWAVPNVKGTEMLTTIPVYHRLEEKVYFALNLEEEEHCKEPTEVELYKVEDCHDVHLRAVNKPDLEENLIDSFGILHPENFLFVATIVDSKGKIVQEEKVSQCFMAGGRRCWEIPSFIRASDFDNAEKFLNSSGDLHIRLAFACKMQFPFEIVNSLAKLQMGESSESQSQSQSNANENLEENKSKATVKDQEALDTTVNSTRHYFAEVALEGYSARLGKLLKRGKFSDGTITVTSPTTIAKRVFPVHRGILSAQSSGFESAFENDTNINFTKYSIRTVEILLTYMYTGELICDQRLQYLKELIDISDEMNIFGLIDKCLYIASDLESSIQSGITCFNLASKYNSIPLRLAAVKMFETFSPEDLMENPNFEPFVKANKLEGFFFPMFVKEEDKEN